MPRMPAAPPPRADARRSLTYASPGVSCVQLLHCASRFGQTEVVKLLLDHGAVARCSDDTGKTPLHDACWGTVSARSALTASASLLLDVDESLLRAADCWGATPLDYVKGSAGRTWQLLLWMHRDRWWPLTSAPGRTPAEWRSLLWPERPLPPADGAGAATVQGAASGAVAPYAGAASGGAALSGSAAAVVPLAAPHAAASASPLVALPVDATEHHAGVAAEAQLVSTVTDGALAAVGPLPGAGCAVCGAPVAALVPLVASAVGTAAVPLAFWPPRHPAESTAGDEAASVDDSPSTASLSTLSSPAASTPSAVRCSSCGSASVGSGDSTGRLQAMLSSSLSHERMLPAWLLVSGPSTPATVTSSITPPAATAATPAISVGGAGTASGRATPSPLSASPLTWRMHGLPKHSQSPGSSAAVPIGASAASNAAAAGSSSSDEDDGLAPAPSSKRVCAESAWPDTTSA